VSLAASARAEPRTRTLADRLLAAIPLLSVFFWICVLYMWEAWRHGSPWLFGDELQMTQLSRAIADTGHAARRGQPYSPDTLYPYFTAPAWLIHNVRHGYSTAKYIDVITMTSTMFWTYGLARFVVGRRAALFAGAGSVLIPSLTFSSMLVPENVAYPYAALCFFLVVWNAGFIFQWGAHLIPARGPVSFSEVARNQFFVVPRQLSAQLRAYLFRRKALMQQIEDRDIQQLKKNPPTP